MTNNKRNDMRIKVNNLIFDNRLNRLRNPTKKDCDALQWLLDHEASLQAENDKVKEQLSQETMKNTELEKIADDMQSLWESSEVSYKKLFIEHQTLKDTVESASDELPEKKDAEIENKKWSHYYLDTFKNTGSGIEPMNWKSLEYYLNIYIGIGEVNIKVRNGAMLIERTE